MTKLIVDGRHVWTAVQKDKVLIAAGGRFTVEGDAYAERMVFTVGENQQAMAGKTFKFTWKIEDGKW